MEFKQLEITPEGNWFKRLYYSQQVRKSVIYILIGAVLGLVFTYFAEGMQINNMNSKDIISNVFFGAFFGFFITNSPCARNKC
ncbi:MAG: hypothetical protein A2W99_10515 [Bacteroidetes bacterium GWF2_33_16]|nr:MAG: hypothetical protein A2X00_05225 [Bacteroidetes bacterium GWE2_32_14]OFY03975.1 MAG: hypothetical protein A2W99_10515 [Bacteroidetes bacterium GWF2_33_16]